MFIIYKKTCLIKYVYKYLTLYLEAVTTLNGHTSGIKHVMFFQNDRRLISCADDKTVRIWDPLSGQVYKNNQETYAFILKRIFIVFFRKYTRWSSMLYQPV